MEKKNFVVGSVVNSNPSHGRDRCLSGLPGCAGHDVMLGPASFSSSLRDFSWERRWWGKKDRIHFLGWHDTLITSKKNLRKTSECSYLCSLTSLALLHQPPLATHYTMGTKPILNWSIMLNKSVKNARE
jgi:hypothetical protein